MPHRRDLGQQPLRPLHAFSKLRLHAPIKSVNRYNWSKFIPAARQKAINENPDLELGWNAQTTIAASYGLMQVLFAEAEKFGTGVINGRRRPYYLFDRPEHVGVEGAGSIPTGTALWAYEFRVANKFSSATEAFRPSFKTPDKMDAMLQAATWRYNGKRSYGAEVMQYQLKYLPIPVGALLK